LRRDVVDHGDAFGIGIRQRSQQHCIDDAEDSGVGADSKRQDDYGPDCEPGILPQYAETVFQILPDVDIQASYRARFHAQGRAVTDVTKVGHVLFQRFGMEAAENRRHTARTCRIVDFDCSFVGWFVRARAECSVMARALSGAS
jgi:hypothetical protein